MVISTNSDEAGAPRHCEILIKELKDRVDFIFVAGEEGAVYKRLQNDESIECFTVPNFRSAISPLFDLLAVYRIILLCKKVKPDLLHLHSSKAGLVGRLVSRIFNIPAIYTIHGFSWRGMPQPLYHIIKTIEIIFAKIHGIRYILVSEKMQNEARSILKLPDEIFTVICNGVPDTQTIQDNFALDNSIKMIMPARVCKAKDHETLLKSMPFLPDYFQLTLCGAGTDKPEFIEYAANLTGDAFKNIKFLGERNDISCLLSNSDIFVLSSNFEALPISIIEAMSSRLPIVASHVGGIPELVDESNGKLFNRGDVNGLTKALLSLANQSERERLGTRSRLKYESKFSSERMTKAIYDEYICAVSIAPV